MNIESIRTSPLGAGGKTFGGVVIPTITPLTENFKLDESAVEKMFANFYRHDVQPFILGTTGEAASLPLELKQDFIKTAGKNKKTGTHLYAGISSNCIEESVELAKFCADNSVDVVVITIPAYYALTESQQRKYFEQLADAIPLPLIIYNIPATTHVSLSLNLVDQLSHHENIVGAKDSERSEVRLAQSVSLWKDRSDFSHFVGWAAKSAQALIDGSDGIIPSTGNLTPAVYSDLAKAVKDGDHAKAFELQAVSDTIGNIYQAGKTLGESLWALKFLMKQRNLCDEFVMPPLQAMSTENRPVLTEAYSMLIDGAGF